MLPEAKAAQAPYIEKLAIEDLTIVGVTHTGQEGNNEPP
jgi:hypothetical protein